MATQRAVVREGFLEEGMCRQTRKEINPERLNGTSGLHCPGVHEETMHKMRLGTKQ